MRSKPLHGLRLRSTTATAGCSFSSASSAWVGSTALIGTNPACSTTNASNSSRSRSSSTRRTRGADEPFLLTLSIDTDDLPWPRGHGPPTLRFRAERSIQAPRDHPGKQAATGMVLARDDVPAAVHREPRPGEVKDGSVQSGRESVQEPVNGRLEGIAVPHDRT